MWPITIAANITTAEPTIINIAKYNIKYNKNKCIIIGYDYDCYILL
jgi:hypothetical protein